MTMSHGRDQMYETQDPTDRLFVVSRLRNTDPRALDHRRSRLEAALPHATSIRARFGRLLIQVGAAIAAEPIEAARHGRPARIRAS